MRAEGNLGPRLAGQGRVMEIVVFFELGGEGCRRPPKATSSGAS